MSPNQVSVFGGDLAEYTAMFITNYFAFETAVEVATEAVQILGGNGYSKVYLVKKFYRDAKLCSIGERTPEIQKLVIASELLNPTKP